MNISPSVGRAFLLSPFSVFTHEVKYLPHSYPPETCKQMFHFSSTYHRNWLMMVKFKLVNLPCTVLYLPNNFVSLVSWHYFLSFSKHIDYLTKKISAKLNILKIDLATVSQCEELIQFWTHLFSHIQDIGLNNTV